MNLRTSLILCVLFTAVFCVKNSFAQVTMPLYVGAVPNSKPAPNLETSQIRDSILIISKISVPAITAYIPAKPNGTAIIICPGGGYRVEAAGHEGADVARKFNEIGITAFVLKYRIPDTATMVNKEIGPVQDAQRAIQMVRENAEEYHLKTNKIGIMGFSAGGHLASTAGTHFQHAYISNPKNTSLRPDFMLLIYPVISFTDSIGHIGSRDQILGRHPSQEKIREYSNELQVTSQTPPTFLEQAKDDPIKVQNATAFAAALKAEGVPYEIYLYEKGGHGYGMNNKTSNVKWMDIAEEWLRKMKFIED
jgi:acetyl esterase/lipase